MPFPYPLRAGGKEPFTDVNVVPRLTRFSRTFATVPSNIAQFRIFDCPDATNPDTPCTVANDLTSLSAETIADPPENSVVTYADGVAMYAAAAFVCAVIAPFLAICFCCCRCNITCCLCGMRGGAWCCGRGIPTQKAPDSCLSCGFEEISDPLVTEEAKPGEMTAVKLGQQEFHYRSADRWATRVCLVVYLALVVTFAAIGHFNGSVRLTEGMVLVSRALDSVVPVAAGLHDSMEAFAIDVTAGAVVPAVRRINNTVHLEASPRRIIGNVFCVLDNVASTLDGISKINGNVSAVLVTLDNIVLNLNDVSDRVPAVNNSVNVVAELGTSGLRQDIVGLAATRDSTPGVANLVASALDGVEASLAAFQSPTSGLPAVSQRLAWYNNRPTPADARTSANDMQLMAVGSMEGLAQQAARTSAIGRLDTLSSKTANLTRVPELVALLNGLNVLVGDFRAQDRAGALMRAINATRDLIAGLPNVTRVLERADRTSGAIESARAALVPIRSSIVALERNVSGLSLSFVGDASRQLDSADRIISCVNAMQGDLDGIGRTVVALPQAVSDLTSQVSSINTSLSEARGFIDVAKTQSDSLDAELAKFSFSSYLASIDGLLAANSSGLGDIRGQASGVTSAIDGVNLDSVYDSVRSVNATVNRPGLTINATTLAELTAVAPLFANISNATALALASARSYDSTRCANTGAVCSVAGDCTGSPCVGGLSLCVPAANPDAGQAGATSCAGPATCPGTDVCTRNRPVLAATAVALRAFANSSSPDLTTAASSVASLRASVDSVTGLAGARSSIATLNSSLSAVTFNASSILDQIDTAVSSSSGAQGSLNAVSSAITGVRGRLDVRTQLSETLTLILSAKSSVDSASAALEPVRSSRTGLESFVDFWYGSLPGLLVNDLSRASLQARGDADGLAGVAVAVASVLGRIAVEAEGAAGAFLGTGSASLLPVNITAVVEEFAPAIRVVGSARIQQLGGIHYGLAVAQQVGNTTGTAIGLPSVLDPASTPAAGAEGASVFVDAQGVAWPRGTICATQQCVARLVQSLNQESVDVAVTSVTTGLETSSADGGSGESESQFLLPFELSREVALSLPLLLPILVALCGCVPVLCMCRCGCQSCCTRCMTCCHQCLSCGCAAVLFLFFGVLLFPIIMVAADGCRSGFNVGASYVQGSEASLCGIVTGKFIEPGICRVQITAGSGSTDVNLDIPRLYESLLGEGGCTAAGRTEVVTTFTALGALSDSILETSINTTVVDAASSAGFPLRTPMRLALLTSARSLGSAARNLLSNLGSSALSCDNVNGMIISATDGVCCGMLGPLYWVVSSYYLIALVMCTLGWGGSVFAYKRLPNTLWGEYYEDALQMPLDSRQERMFQRRQEREGDKASLSSAMQPRSSQVSPATHGAAVDHDGIVEGEFQFKARPPRAAPPGGHRGSGSDPRGSSSARPAGAGSQAI